jgi:hypothetical protein
MRGTAEKLEVIRLDDEPVDTFHVEIRQEKPNEVATFQTDATLALKTLGFANDVTADVAMPLAGDRCA